jgi:hypothetical protein
MVFCARGAGLTRIASGVMLKPCHVAKASYLSRGDRR